MLYQNTYSRVIECQSGEFLQELIRRNLFGESKLVDLYGWSRMIRQSGLPDPLLNQFIESAEVGRPAILRVALRLHWVVLDGCNMGQELLVE